MPKADHLSKLQYKSDILYRKTKIQVHVKEKMTKFAWSTYIKITIINKQKFIYSERNRWKIENQGFNRQKYQQGNIELACIFNERSSEESLSDGADRRFYETVV